ncbi:hypothetical protein CXG81DRAFT_26210 [Caulochytrium protostelioides]|uniref:Uncharacterized protein n=1 Tax=Caulochytrium protostelioides TaxID=1555241 RepID=A0A4P9X793_9FUNG|nr:hypothetical protein CXG81DRAFT_26210 [Caulochytrium protostelioides]|eukprot:RKP01107.1 hypothetical protein CXG81DRAFT_26210 [Caulochytrium protostelioides]
MSFLNTQPRSEQDAQLRAARQAAAEGPRPAASADFNWNQFDKLSPAEMQARLAQLERRLSPADFQTVKLNLLKPRRRGNLMVGAALGTLVLATFGISAYKARSESFELTGDVLNAVAQEQQQREKAAAADADAARPL